MDDITSVFAMPTICKTSSPMTSETNSPGPGNQGWAHLQGQDSIVPQRQPTGGPVTLYVNGACPILLQTAKAVIHKPGSPGVKSQVRLLLDSGSHRTYVTTQVKEELGLLSEGRQSTLIKTLGSMEERTQTVDIVHLSVETAPSLCSAIDMRASTEPGYSTGCQLPQASVWYQTSRLFNWWWGCECGYLGRIRPILEPGDRRGQARRRGPHSHAHTTGMGAIRPNGKLEQVRQYSNLVSTHVMKSAVQPLSNPRDSREGDLQKFWELESLGIQPWSVHEELVETIFLKNNHYEV